MSPPPPKLRRRRGREAVIALVMAGLVAAAGTLLGLAIAYNWQSDEPSGSMRPASPEEIAAATETEALADDGRDSRTADPAFERAPADAPAPDGT